MRESDKVTNTALRIARAGVYRANWLGALAILAALVAVVMAISIPNKDSPFLLDVYRVVVTHIRPITVMFGLGILWTWIPISWRISVFWGWQLRSGFGRDLFEIANRQLVASASIVLVLATAVLSVTVWFGFFALSEIWATIVDFLHVI